MPETVRPDRLPRFSTAPLRAEDGDAPFALGLVLRLDRPQAPFLLLRRTFGASIFLGCSRDRAGAVKSLLEIWVQEADAAQASLRGPVVEGGNAEGDAAWARLVAALSEVDGERLVRTGWEKEPLPPIEVDAPSGRTHAVADPETGGPLCVCTDDDALKTAGLPPYGLSRQRFLWDRAAPGKPRLYRFARPGEERAAAEMASALPANGRVFNPHGGRLLVRAHAPLSLSEYADVLSGSSWTSDDGAQALLPPGIARALTDPDPQKHAWLLHGRNSPDDRLSEALFLKLNLLTQALEALHAHTRVHRRPFLGLGAESFRVDVAAGATGLPSAWSACVHLVDVPVARPLELPGIDLPYFVRPEPVVASVYQPKSVTGYHRGVARVRLREIARLEGGACSLELTFAADDALEAAASDLLRVSLPSEAGALDVYGHPDAGRGLAAGELRVRTFPVSLDEASLPLVQRSAGVPLSAVPYELLPRLSSPYDGYAVAVLACRLVLAGPDLPLPVVVDELLSFARVLSAGSAPLTERITEAFAKDERWTRTLGPAHVRAEPGSTHAIPWAFWAEVLAAVVRLLPGAVPESHCRDWGDAPPLAPERAHEAAIAEFRSLCTLLRGWVLRETEPNREVRAVIDDFRASTLEGPAPDGRKRI